MRHDPKYQNCILNKAKLIRQWRRGGSMGFEAQHLSIDDCTCPEPEEATPLDGTCRDDVTPEQIAEIEARHDEHCRNMQRHIDRAEKECNQLREKLKERDELLQERPSAMQMIGTHTKGPDVTSYLKWDKKVAAALGEK